MGTWVRKTNWLVRRLPKWLGRQLCPRLWLWWWWSPSRFPRWLRISPGPSKFRFALILKRVLVSARDESSLQIFENSAEERVTTELYSVSGMPSCSESSWRRFRLNSENRSFSKLKRRTLAFKGESDGGRFLFCLERNDVVVAGAFQDFRQVFNAQSCS